MASILLLVTGLSSPILRTVAYVFFRWVRSPNCVICALRANVCQIPGHQLVPTIYTTALIYFTSFLCSLYFTSPNKSPGPGGANVNGRAQDKRHQSVVQVKVKGRAYEHKQTHDGSTVRNLVSAVLGTPNPRSGYWNLVTGLINLLLVLGTLDVVYRAKFSYPSHDLAFARVGYVSDTSVKILCREPSLEQLPIYISYRAVPESGLDDSWKSAGKVYLLSNDTDYTSTQEITSLRPSTRYQYAISNNHSGFFTTAAPPGQITPGTSKFTFLTSSCIKPRFPYNPLAHPLSIPGLHHLAAWLPDLKASFLLFLGDFIYIDVPHRHGTTTEDYRREYRQVYGSPSWPPVSQSLPWLHVIDDHEIANDWSDQQEDPYPAAIDPWSVYHASVNPPPAHQNATYFTFTQGPASFFMLDTRRYRDPASPDAHPSSNTKTMLGATQLSSLLHFLHRDEPTGVKWKFVISSIPFTRNWRINAQDTWAGFLHERRIVLEAMWDVGMRGDGIGVVVLSGDRHEFGATAFPPPKDDKWPISATVHEFSTSPLSMFYLPFRSYWEVKGEDDIEEVCIKYVPDGNSKFAAVELEEVKGGDQGLLRFRLIVDGKEIWDYVLMTPPAVGGGSRGKDAIWG